jgi:predicted nucleic acid-binding protein
LLTELGRQIQSIVEAPDTDVHAPEVCDVEFISGLRRMNRDSLTEDRAYEALLDYVTLPLIRHAHLRFVRRMFDLRENFTSSDATYVALAEDLDATLVTCDLRLTRAARQFTDLNVVGVG